MNKHIAFAIILALGAAMAACSSNKLTSEEKAQLETRRAEYVINHINTNHFTIDVDRMTPNRGISRQLSYGYGIIVKGDTLTSFLPYFGRAYSLPYGGGKVLNFESKITARQLSRNNKKMLTTLHLFTTNDEDTYQYIVEIFDNGRSHIEVRSRLREAISFDGNMKLPDEIDH
ncbi:MAG: DUF4251 domain-containing protein [Muribaculaceae bacterium]